MKASYKVSVGDEIAVSIPELDSTEVLPEPIDLNIVYEDHDIIVINKSKGMVVHPAPGHYSGTLVNALLYICLLCFLIFLFPFFYFFGKFFDQGCHCRNFIFHLGKQWFYLFIPVSCCTF